MKQNIKVENLYFFQKTNPQVEGHSFLKHCHAAHGKEGWQLLMSKLPHEKYCYG